MMKGTNLIVQEQKQVLMDHENISNLTCASGDQASVSSENIRAEDGISTCPQHYFTPPPIQTLPPLKKRRNLPGNPDPDAEVIALSPKSLMATNRFVCEVCNKGFQRDQNLQLHRRGHSLPWKLKQRTANEVVKKKVYVCPEAGCVHHDPSRALGDLTGIKKHFCRKHGEKKWKCDKCSKRYAVQSDWKAHSKTCGTREYRCDCGTLFSRRDSFITHRAFCDALAEESARAAGTGLNPHIQQGTGSTDSHLQQVQIPQFTINGSHSHRLTDLQNPYSIKKEQQTFPPWLSYPPAALVGLGPGPRASQGPLPPPIDLISTPSSSSSSASQSQPLIFNTRVLPDQEFPHDENPNPSGPGPTLPPYHPTTASAHMSATALLQKAAQMGAAAISSSKATAAAPCSTTTSNCQWCPSMTMTSRPHHQAHVAANSVNNNTCTTTGFGLNLLSSHDLHPQEMALSSFGNNKPGPLMNPPPSFFHHQDHMLLMNSYDGSTAYEDAALVSGFLDAKKLDQDHDGGTISDHDHDLNLHHQLMLSSTSSVSSGITNEELISGSGGNMGGRGGGNDGMTRDFLGLRALSHSDILNMAGLGDSTYQP